MGQLIKPTVDAVGWTYGLVSVLVFVVGGLTNSFTLAYFFSKSKKGDIANLLYSNITLTDLLLCIMLLPVGVSFLEEGTSWLSDHTICNVWGMFWTISNQMSIFLILTFNVCRTKALLFPFAKNSMAVVKGVICLYILLMVIQVCLPYFFKSSYSLNSDFLICHWDYQGLFGKDSQKYWIIFGLFNIVERVIPFIAVLLSCCISYVLLIGQQRAETEDLDVQCPQREINWWERLFCKKRAINNLNKVRFRQPPDKLKLRATYTILLATVNYTVLNLPNVIYMILAFSDLLRPEGATSLLSFDTKNHFVTFSLVMCAGLHAVVTPLIWYWRMAGLRKFYKETLYKTATLFRCLKEQGRRLPFSTRMSNTNGTSEDGVIANPMVGMVSNGTITNRRSSIVTTTINGPEQRQSTTTINLTEQRQSTATNPPLGKHED
ncbi:uncharacterized protein LOC134823622 [Bolinopsis microptera]|uniref:uncharacterized protein LOC134823622 n=1 Tax=Bolinopsis microptera TaxID=2820187 RepID=UPI003079973F